MDPSLSVLLAEDNLDDAFLMQRAFKDHGLSARRTLWIMERTRSRISPEKAFIPTAVRTLFPAWLFWM